MSSLAGSKSSPKRPTYAILGILVAVGMVSGLALSAVFSDAPATGAAHAPATAPGTVDPAPVLRTGVSAAPHPAAGSSLAVTFKETGLPFGSRWSVSAGLAGSVATGDLPVYDAVDTANGYVYVTDQNSSDVRVLNGASDQLVTSIPTMADPSGIVFDSTNGELYVADSNSSNVTVINGVTNTVLTTIPVGAPCTSGIAFDAATNEILVAMNATNSVAVINAASNSVAVASIRVGSDPLGVAVDPTNGYIYVTNSGSSNVSVLNGSSNLHVGSVHVGTGPRGIALDSTNGYLYVANYRSHNVTVVNGATDHVVTSLPTGNDPEWAAFDPANGDVYVTVASSNNVTVVSGASDQVTALVPVGSEPQGVAYDPANGHLFVVDYGSNNVTVLNGATNRDVAPVQQSATGNYMVFQEPAGPLPYSISGPAGYGVSKVVGASRPSQTEALVSGNVTITAVFGPLEPVTFDELGLPSGTVWGVQMTSALPYGGPIPQSVTSSRIGQDAYLGSSAVLETSAVGSEPTALALDTETGYVYVSDSGASVLSQLNGSSGQVVGSVPVSGQPKGLAFDSANGYLFVVSTGSSHRLTVIEAAIDTVLKTVHLPAAPEGIAFDPANGYLYVTLSTGVQVINATSDATVTTLTAGTDPAGVTYDPANGFLYVANVGSNNLTVINGTSDLVIGAIPVGSAPTSVVVDSANGNLYVTNSNSSNLTVVTPVGERSVGAIPVGSEPFGAAFDSANGYLYVANNGSGNLSVVDPVAGLPLGAIPVGTAPQAVLFVPGASAVFVADSGSGEVTGINGSATGGGTALHFTAVKGAWKYSLTTKPITYSASPAHASLGVSSHAVTKTIKFRPVGQTVIFHRTGSAVPGSWTVNLTGPENLTLVGTLASLKVVLVNGTYHFTASNFTAVHPHPANGSFTVVASHTPLTITITYTALPHSELRKLSATVPLYRAATERTASASGPGRPAP